MRALKTLLLIAMLTFVAACGTSSEGTSDDADSARLWQEGFPTETLEEVNQMPLDEVVKSVHVNEELSANKKADVIISLAYDSAGDFSEEQMKEHTEEVLTHFNSREIVTNQDKEFLLRQAYLGASMDEYFAVTLVGDAVGFDYMQIARDLYRETATPDDDFIQGNIHQIEKALSN